MKKLPRKPEIFETLDLYKRLSSDEQYKLKSEESDERFIDKISRNFHIVKNNPIAIQGLRTQSMFEFVVSSLKKIKLMKTEDSGDLYSEKDKISPPDFRVVLENNQEILIEVKNYYQKDPMKPYSFKKNYFESLLEYSDLFNLKLKVGIYWTRWNMWTLVDSKKFILDGNKYVLSFIDSYKNNEMYILGDLMIATVPPLEMRIIADKNKIRDISESGLCKFYIGGIEFYCGGNLISDKYEMTIAHNLMLFSEWPIDDPIAEVENNKLNHFSFIAKPEERTEGQDFEMLGTLSSLISKQFRMLTAPDGKIEKISPQAESTKLGTFIPFDYKGKQLPLWRFSIMPPKDQIETDVAPNQGINSE